MFINSFNRCIRKNEKQMITKFLIFSLSIHRDKILFMNNPKHIDNPVTNKFKVNIKNKYLISMFSHHLLLLIFNFCLMFALVTIIKTQRNIFSSSL